MANGLEVGGRTMKGISTMSLERLTDGLPFNWAAPTTFAINEGIEQQEQEGKNEVGETVRIGNFTRVRKPTLTIGYNNITPEMMSWKIGNYLEVGTYRTRMPKRLWVTRPEFAGSSEGSAGFGIPVDAGYQQAERPRAAVTRGVLSTALIQEPWDDFDSWKSNQMRFAVGANGALRFSNDIVVLQDIVTMSLPLTQQMSRISDVVVGDHRISTLMVDSLNQIHVVEVFQARPDLSAAGLDLSSDTFELQLFLQNPPGSCRSWQMYSPVEHNQVKCAAE